MTDEVPTNQSDQSLVPTTKPVGRKKSPYGAKIAKSPYRDEITTMILSGKGTAEILRVMAEKGFKLNWKTVVAFKDNYVAKLDEEVKDKVMRGLIEKESKAEQEIISYVAHHKLSEVDSTIALLRDCEKQVAVLNSIARPNGFELSSLGNFLDRIRFLRQHLAKLRGESESEQAREQAILDICEIVFDIWKDDSERMQVFMQKAADYRERKRSYGPTTISE